MQLKSALAELLEAEGAVKPKRVRFFRGQMQTIISRALGELDIKPVPSRRCFALIGAHMQPGHAAWTCSLDMGLPVASNACLAPCRPCLLRAMPAWPHAGLPAASNACSKEPSLR